MDIRKVENWLNTNYAKQQSFKRTNKVDLACQRLINFAIMKQLFSNIVGVYASPISSDIAFRMNIFSPLISAATISVLFLICNQFIDRLDSKINLGLKNDKSLLG